MAKEIKGENIADVFLIVSQILFFMAIVLNYSTNLIPKIPFILVALQHWVWSDVDLHSETSPLFCER